MWAAILRPSRVRVPPKLLHAAGEVDGVGVGAEVGEAAAQVAVSRSDLVSWTALAHSLSLMQRQGPEPTCRPITPQLATAVLVRRRRP